MTDLYLIAHKVHGEPAFDIAIRLDQLDEDGDLMWIIPTSGHRAYPYNWAYYEFETLLPPCPEGMPSSLPDHYHHSATPSTKLDGQSLLASLGLAKPRSTNFKRRI